MKARITHARHTAGNERQLHAQGHAGASCEPLQRRHASARPRHALSYLVLIAENAALDAIRPYLEPGESAVGTAINLNHLAPTPAGHTVRGRAEVIKVEGRRIAFKVSVRDEIEEIGNGTHTRAVIDVARFMERLKAKAAP